MNKTQVENRGLDKDLFERICSSVDAQLCHQTMRLKITYLGKGVAGMKMSPQKKFSTQGGRLHGGVIATLADTVMGVATFTINGQIYRTLDMNMNYMAPGFADTELTAEASVIHLGQTIALVEGSLFNKGKLIARSQGTFIRDTKTSLSEGDLTPNQ